MSDLEGRCFRRAGNTLVPVDFAADEMLAEIPEGKEVVVTYRKPRSPLHHRWFFAMLRKVCEATGRWHDEDELLDAVKLATGHVRRVQRLDGEVILMPRSINFASMPEGPFTRFKNRALFVIGQATGVDPETLMRETNATQPVSISPTGAGEMAARPPESQSPTPRDRWRAASPLESAV